MKTLLLLLLLALPCMAGPTLMLITHTPESPAITEGADKRQAIDESYTVHTYGLNADGSSKTFEFKTASELNKIVDIEEANFPDLLIKPVRIIIYFNEDETIHKIDYHLAKPKIIDNLNEDSKSSIEALKTLIESK